MQYQGKWRITEMDEWDSDYLDMEVEAYIEIDSKGSGEFQFGLVFGQIDGVVVKNRGDERLEFTWEGNDESEATFGSGWLQLNDKDSIEGRIKIHQSDSSGLVAERIK